MQLLLFPHGMLSLLCPPLNPWRLQLNGHLSWQCIWDHKSGAESSEQPSEMQVSPDLLCHHWLSGGSNMTNRWLRSQKLGLLKRLPEHYLILLLLACSSISPHTYLVSLFNFTRFVFCGHHIVTSSWGFKECHRCQIGIKHQDFHFAALFAFFCMCCSILMICSFFPTLTSAQYVVQNM